MGGTIRGQIDCYCNETTEYRNAAVVWKVWQDFFTAHPLMTRIAYQVGSGGTGTDFWDGANPWGSHCWAVWEWGTSAARAYPIYVLLQCTTGGGATGQTPGQAPGDPAIHGGTSSSSGYGHVFLNFAIGVGGDENPWNGTSNNDGTDTKGGSAAMPVGNDGNGAVWRVPAAGSSVLCYPRSNSNGGAYDTVRHDNFPIFNENGAIVTRFNVIMDDDNLMLYAGSGFQRYLHAGLMTPHEGLTVDRPWLAFYTTTPVNEATIQARHGGAPFPDSTDGEPVRLLNLDGHDFFATNGQPNGFFSPAEYELAPLYVRIEESPTFGLLGSFGVDDDFHVFGHNIPQFSTSLTKDRIVFGSTTVAQLRHACPWDGTTVYGSNFTRVGITF